MRRTPRGPVPTKQLAAAKRKFVPRRCHCQACREGKPHAHPWQDQYGDERDLIEQFLNEAVRHSKNSNTNIYNRLGVVNTISWLREALDWT